MGVRDVYYSRRHRLGFLSRSLSFESFFFSFFVPLCFVVLFPAIAVRGISFLNLLSNPTGCAVGVIVLVVE